MTTFRFLLACGAALLAAPSFAAADPTAAPATGRRVHEFAALVISPDGRHVASIEDDRDQRAAEPVERLVIRAVDRTSAVTVKLPCGDDAACRPEYPAFTADGKRVGFVLHKPGDENQYLEEVGLDGQGLQERAAFTGALGRIIYGPGGKLAVLAIAGAHKEAGAVKAAAAVAGEIGVSEDEQRIAVLEGSALRFVSPADLYVYEFDWLPDGRGFVGTAAPGNGDDAWWVARLWRFAGDGRKPKVLFTPPPQEQLASPAVSPDGKHVAFIGGIMSDFGSTGGDAYLLALDGTTPPVDLTPGIKASITGLGWHCGPGLTATALRADKMQLLALGGRDIAPRPLSSDDAHIGTGGWSSDVACGHGVAAAVQEDFNRAPEIEAGPIGSWRALTQANAGISNKVEVRSLRWKSDGYDVQGWLLQPAWRQAADNQPMVTVVHGGPSGASMPQFLTERRELWLLDAGYDVFLPNPRGSFGQGEAFTRANIRDFGHGDLRDILRGVDAALEAAPIDPARLGLMGYSYGGYMTMWAVTQTDRFKAAVAGAGVSDWRSYYGQNGISDWMIPFFGASVYDDPRIFARSSPIEFIKKVRTPTFVFVGDRDLECPMPQSQEFWHALRTLGIPTEFVVYPGQGHEMHDPAARADSQRRSLAWFARWLGK